MGLSKRIDLLNTEKEVLSRTTKSHQDRIGDCERRLLQQGKEMEISRREINQWLQDADAKFSQFTELMASREKMTESQLKDSFDRQNDSIFTFSKTIE